MVNWLILFCLHFADLENMIGQPQKLIDNAKKVRTSCLTLVIVNFGKNLYILNIFHHIQLKSDLESVQEMSCCAVDVPSHGDDVK